MEIHESMPSEGRSYELLNQLIGRDGFAQLRAADLFQGSPLVDVVAEKTSELRLTSVCEQQLARDVRFLAEVLRETLARRYTGLSVLAFAHILVALDYFVRVVDEVPDTQAGGYADDLLVVSRALKQFRQEFEDYKAWKLKRGAKW